MTPTAKIDFPFLACTIHSDNVVAGWFTDIDTGESIEATRNRPEMMMLGVTELAEALDGSDGRPDDKLPHIAMFDVELADFAIRVLDLIGCEVACGHEMPMFDTDVAQHTPVNVGTELMLLVRQVSRAMEHYRKRRMDCYLDKLAEAVVDVFMLAEQHSIDLLSVIEEKRDFNRVRIDHQLENRRAAGGKKC